MRFAPVLFMLVAFCGADLSANAALQLEHELRGVEVIERIGERIPRGLKFTDDNNREVALEQYFKPGRPVLITLNYTNCPRLCSYQLTDLARALAKMGWTPGEEFVLLTVSVDPAEDYKTAKKTKLRYLAQVGKAEADKGWHFLTTTAEQDILTLANALGYKYVYDAETGEYRHKAAMFIVNGDGVISHYLRNLAYNPDNVQSLLAASARGELGSPNEDESGFGLNCFAFEYTDNMGRAFNFMRIGGVGILIFLFSFVGYWWVREFRKPREPNEPGAPTPAEAT